MSLCEQFQTDLKQAMKSGDKVRLATLRLLMAAIKNRQIDKGGALDDAEALDVVRLATKQRREAIAFARQYAREDIAQQEEQELAILETYLPEQLNTDDLVQRIDAVIQELRATSDKDLGRVMRVLMPAVKGRADGNTVNRLVRERLGILAGCAHRRDERVLVTLQRPIGMTVVVAGIGVAGREPQGLIVGT